MTLPKKSTSSKKLSRVKQACFHPLLQEFLQSHIFVIGCISVCTMRSSYSKNHGDVKFHQVFSFQCTTAQQFAVSAASAVAWNLLKPWYMWTAKHLGIPHADKWVKKIMKVNSLTRQVIWFGAKRSLCALKRTVSSKADYSNFIFYLWKNLHI